MAASLEQQLELLIAEAPQDGKTPQAIEAIAPLLYEIAQQFQHLEYFVLQSLQQNWQITTLQNTKQPEQTKVVLYGYGELKDATQAGQAPNLIAKGIPIIDLLFQFSSLKHVDSLILFEREQGNLSNLEIHRQQLNQLIQQQLETLLTQDSDHGSILA
ncbi:MAG: hypothetical protein HC810_04585 [Acaryochloridaceae cyanobacterium RL_2_7]|nr:hypothetical protein [Acaryochloridaceae cyanobacterium RL_2_7]